MDYIHIQSLLERYWEGETTLAEERALKNYFLSGKVDERLRDVAPLFQTLSAAQQVVAPNTLAQIIKPKVVSMKVGYSSIWYKTAAAAALVGIIASAVWYFSTNQQQTNMPVVVAPPAEKILDTPPVPQDAITEVVPHTPVVEAAKPVKKKKKIDNKPNLAPPSPVEESIQSDDEAYTEAEAQQALEEVIAALELVSSKINKGKNDLAKPLSKVNFDTYFPAASDQN